jgi:polyhydroxybutyrate depolymerase
MTSLLGWLCASALSAVPAVAACDTAGLTAGAHTLNVHSGGLTRPVLVFIPPAAGAHAALPLVFDLHGSGGNGEQQARSTRLSDVGAKHGFVVANPTGGVSFPAEPEKHYWNIPGVPLFGAGATPANAPDDVQFISDTIDQISASTCIDARRVYVTGMSGGGRMSSLLGCKLSQRFAAIAPVAGLRAGLPSKDDPYRPQAESCRPQRPMPIVTFHGTDDQTNRYDGDGGPRWGYSIAVALHRWVELDQCRDLPDSQKVAPHVTLLRYTQCAGGAEIWFYKTELPGDQGGGHAWPGGAIPPAMLAPNAPRGLRANIPGTEINASELMWQFFSRHVLPVAAAGNTRP